MDKKALKKLWAKVKPFALALWETAKFPLRVFVLSVLPFVADYFFGLGYVWAVKVSTVLVLADKLLHNLWKENKDIKLNGIVPF